MRPLAANDLEAVADWHEGAEELRGRLEDAECGVLAITRCEEDSAIGVVEYRVGYPEEGWLSVEFVAVEPRVRGLGLDSEAVRLLEEEVLERGWASRFCAPVRHGDGLALYFWLRLGYRPAVAAESPWPGGAPRDMMAMVRNPQPRRRELHG